MRERRPSTSAPLVELQGSVGPAGMSRPKHKRTFTGFGAGDIKSVEGESVPSFMPLSRARVSCGIPLPRLADRPGAEAPGPKLADTILLL